MIDVNAALTSLEITPIMI